MSRTFKLAAAAIFAVLATPVALAKTPAPPAGVRVSYGDLDLSQPTGGATLLGRIQQAARTSCGPAWKFSQLTPHAAAECQASTVASVVSQLRIPTLSAALEHSDAALAFASR